MFRLVRGIDVKLLASARLSEVFNTCGKTPPRFKFGMEQQCLRKGVQPLHLVPRWVADSRTGNGEAETSQAPVTADTLGQHRQTLQVDRNVVKSQTLDRPAVKDVSCDLFDPFMAEGAVRQVELLDTIKSQEPFLEEYDVFVNKKAVREVQRICMATSEATKVDLHGIDAFKRRAGIPDKALSNRLGSFLLHVVASEDDLFQ
mmetsp:Transcript_26327/g.65433  ORF Transcript_26327/g.65433 Transcript_26327/m.65433 type:complete len:202 (-) Transcript_26327:1654-2259(-)